MDTEQQRRVAANEARFRDANEKTVEALASFRENDGELPVMCECAATECLDMIHMTLDEYREVRADPTWFVVRPHHFIPAAERTVRTTERYWVIEKVSGAAEVAPERA